MKDRRKFLVLGLALASILALSTGAGIPPGCIDKLQYLYCDSECDTFWAWCVEGSDVCYADSYGCVSSTNDECCNFDPAF